MNLSVFGAGSWGTALAESFASQGHDITLWCRDADQAHQINTQRHNPKRLSSHKLHHRITATADLKLAAQPDHWIIATPAQTLRAMLTDLSPWYRPSVKILGACKGIEISSLLLPHQVAQQVLPGCSFGDLSGPSHAEEVIQHLPACLVVACADESTAQHWQQNLNSPTFRLYRSNDLIGVEVGGAVKNILAIASGFMHQQGLGDNASAAMVTRGLAEMTRLSTKLGGQSHTILGLAGVGDLIVTAFSPHSRNFRMGQLLGQRKTVDQALQQLGQVAEGVPTALALNKLALNLNLDLPIAQAVYHVLYHNHDPKKAVSELLGRSLKAEHESY